MDDATWGQFAEGWRGGTGADADHLKTTADVDVCLAAGFAMFTIDPSEHVDSSADTADLAALRAKAGALPWADLEDTDAAARKRYLGRTFEVEHLKVAFDEATLLRAEVKYGRAVAHVARMSRHLLTAAAGRPVELEVSVDETDTPTSPAEHYWVASELVRLGVRWVSLAPRFVGRFEKGVDYIGDLDALEEDVAAHAAIARRFGPYKLSLHSGSDKFSVYPIAARLAKGLVHLKTAGTSYLEALRTVAAVDPALFREIYAFARERYDTDKASYHVSAELGRAPEAADVREADLPALLEQFDAREILHVTFGSVLKQARPDGTLALQGPAVRPPALEPRGVRGQPRAPLRRGTCGRSSRRNDDRHRGRRRPRPRHRLPAPRRGAAGRPRRPRQPAARRRARARARPRRHAHDADAAPLRRPRPRRCPIASPRSTSSWRSARTRP